MRATQQVHARVGALGQCPGWMSLDLRVVVPTADPRPADPVGQELVRLLAAG